MRIIDIVSYRKIFFVCLILVYLIPLTSSDQVESSYIEPELITDFERIELLLEKAEEIKEFDQLQAIELAEEAKDLAIKTKSIKYQIESLISISDSYRKYGNQDESINFGENALLLAKNTEDNLSLSKALRNIAYVYITFTKNLDAFEICSQLLSINVTAVQLLRGQKHETYDYKCIKEGKKYFLI